MPFEFAWEGPARAFGAAAVIGCAAFLAFAAYSASRRRKAAAVVAIAFAAACAVAYDGRAVAAKRLFPDVSGVVEERVGLHMLAYGDCAGYVAKIGKGKDDGGVCRVRVLTDRGRWIAPGPVPEGWCAPSTPMVREWRFAKGSIVDACAP